MSLQSLRPAFSIREGGSGRPPSPYSQFTYCSKNVEIWGLDSDRSLLERGEPHPAKREAPEFLDSGILDTLFVTSRCAEAFRVAPEAKDVAQHCSVVPLGNFTSRDLMSFFMFLRGSRGLSKSLQYLLVVLLGKILVFGILCNTSLKTAQKHMGVHQNPAHPVRQSGWVITGSVPRCMPDSCPIHTRFIPDAYPDAAITFT